MSALSAAVLGGLALRAAVACWGHSGEATPPMYGDFEAQRHWMEVTTALPMRDWYFNSTENDLLYWGLDYPPLTAYVSYGFGRAAQVLVPPLVELHTSRGHESLAGKVFMRGTVMISDILIFVPALLLLSRLLSNSKRDNLAVFVMSLLAPSLILIDHGHFQYNSISIGLTLLAVVAIVKGQNCLGSVLFSLSLNFKQMSLYHSPVFFVVLLRKCIMRGIEGFGSDKSESHESNKNKKQDALSSYSPFRSFKYLILIGGTVIATFSALWLPFCYVTLPQQSTCSGVLLQILSRIFPFSRGIFEDKVSNLWYLTSVIYDYRNLVSQVLLVRGSLGLTVLLLVPVCYSLGTKEATPKRFILGLIVSALAFFLASFQVHEKSLLLALVPASLLILNKPYDILWFQLAGCMSLHPLLIRDGQMLPYWLCNFFYVYLWLLFCTTVTNNAPSKENVSNVTYAIYALRKLYFVISIPGFLLLHMAEIFIKAPEHLPDLYPALFSLFGCCNLLWYYLYFSYWMLSSESESVEIKHAKRE